MLRPTSISAISIDSISNAVPESNPLLNTVFEIISGFSNTSECLFAEPTVVTTPSPTRAIIVSSPAPPTKRSILARTVTLALAIISIPSLATAAISGVTITLGFTENCTASKTLRPAKSIAAAFSNSKSMSAR